MSAALHLVRIVLDRRELARLAVRHRLPQGVDAGYLIHAGLSQLFATSEDPAEVPLATFAEDDTYAATQERPEQVFLLAYSEEDATALEARMGPSRRSLLLRCASKPMPTLRPGQTVGFRVRACPVVRTRTPGDRPLGTDARGKTRHRELDAFVHATLGVPRDVPVSREAVYAAWFRQQTEGFRACDVHGVELRAFRREVLRRRGSPRLERPDALLEGELTVTDPAAFQALLARGVGRHRAFGYGMLLLRPPSSRAVE